MLFFKFHSFQIKTPNVMHLQIKMKRTGMYLEGDLGGSGTKMIMFMKFWLPKNLCNFGERIWKKSSTLKYACLLYICIAGLFESFQELFTGLVWHVDGSNFWTKVLRSEFQNSGDFLSGLSETGKYNLRITLLLCIFDESICNLILVLQAVLTVSYFLKMLWLVGAFTL